MSHDGAYLAFEGRGRNTDNPFTPEQSGIFSYSTADSSFSRIIGDGDSIGGGTFDMSLANRQIAVNTNGAVAFNGNLDGKTPTTNTGIFMGGHNAAVVDAIALEGTLAPGRGVGLFENFGSSISDTQLRGINDLNQTFFRTDVLGSVNGLNDDQRMIQGNSGGLTAVAVEGSSAPGGGIINNVGFANFNDVGGAVFSGSNRISNLGSKIWSTNSAGGLEEVASAFVFGGTETSEGALRSLAGNPHINNNNEMVYGGWTSAGGTADRDTFLFKATDSMPQAILAEGDAAPDGNGVFANINHLNGRFNDRGEYISGFTLRGTSGGTTDDTGIFKVDLDGNVTQLLREGQASPLLGVVDDINELTSVAINNSGVAALRVSMVLQLPNGDLSRDALVVTDGIDLFEVVAEAPTQAANDITSFNFATGTYGNYRSTQGINEYGQVAFTETAGPGYQAIKIWTPELHHRGGTTDFGDGNAWTLSLTPNVVHDVFIGSDNDSLVGLGVDTSVKSLTIGGGSGNATLAFASDVTLIADELLLRENGNVFMVAGSEMKLGTLRGSGAISSQQANIDIKDLLSPGESAGVIDFEGNLTLGSDVVSMFELGGVAAGEFDQIIGLNSLLLNGDLQISLIDGFTLANGMQFNIFEATTLSGQFDGLAEGSLVGNFGGSDLFISYTGNSVSLFTAVPEPAAASVLLMGLGLVIVRRQRRV